MVVSVESRPLRYSHTIGTMAPAGAGFRNPVDLAIGDEGLLYVLNRGDFRCVTTLGQGIRVTRCTVDGDYLDEFGNPGTEDGHFIWPTSIALDSRGNVYVSDEYRHDIQIFDRDGVYLGKWGSQGDGDGQLNRPSGLAIDADDTVIVVDHLNNRIQRFDLDGRPLDRWGSAGSGDGQFDRPWGVALDAEGQVYVADWRNDRVQKFSRSGQHLATFGSSGNGEGQLNRPAGVGVDGDGSVYVADWGNERVQVFDAGGRPVTTLLGDADLSKWAIEYVASNQHIVEGRKVAADLEPEKRFWGPTAVKIDREGRVLVAESCRHRIQIYEPSAISR